MELRDALTQISEIRAQMARTQIFRGYRSITAAFSGVVALATAGIQALYMPTPGKEPAWYVALWGGAAVLCMGVVGVEMAIRTRRAGSGVQAQLTLLAVEQFMPSVVAGGMLTWVLLAVVPEAFWMLPGMWMILFALGVFASCRLLPRATFWVGGFYLIVGLLYFVVRARFALSPWAMGVPFAVGQFAAAGILYLTLEWRHG